MRWRLSTALILTGLLLTPLCLVGGILVASAAAEVRPGSNKERRFWSAREGVGVEAPSGWTLSMHTGYANILCSLVHPGGSRISLAVDRTNATSASGLVAESRAGLAAQGIVVDRTSTGVRGGVLLDAKVPRRNQAVRQLYIVRSFENEGWGHQAIVVTLAAPTDQLTSVSGAFDWVLGHLALETPSRPEAKPDGGR